MTEFKKLPTHVSIIMDGNGRWAQSRGLERTAGHVEGVRSVHSITEACVELGIRYLSLFAFSEENWGRPQEEVSTLMNLMGKALCDELETLVANGVRLVVLGNRERIPSILNESIKEVEKQTEGGKNLTLIVFLSYSGKWDLLQAARRLAADFPDGNFTEEDFSSRLITAGIPDPDLLIRTSGEQRISNYLLWQLAYTEFVFTDTLWPDFRKESLVAALREYESRDRRFGKVK